MSAMVAVMAAALAAAPFEGELELQLGGSQIQGKAVLLVSREGMRSEVTAQLLGRPFTAGLLVRAEDPEVGLALDPVRRNYVRVPLDEAAMAFREQGGAGLQVEPLGTEKVLGIDCQRVRVRGPAGFDATYWVSAGLLDARTARLVNQSTVRAAGVEAALRKAGAGGIVLRMEQRAAGATVTMMLTRAERRAVPPDALRVPAGYVEIPGVLGKGATLKDLAALQKLPEAERKAALEELRRRGVK